MGDHDRIRLVLLGGAGVGKSAIVKRFLFNTFTDKYRSTVEDLFSREYDLGPVSLKVDILDTAGDMQFPAMRRLSIATAHAFLLVYAVTSSASFATVKRCLQEVREQRPDFQEIPIVVAGNKLDLAATHREVAIEDVSEWLFCELPKLRAKVLECSARDDYNVRDVFRTLLTLSRILPASGDEVTSGLKRRSSAYVSASKAAHRRGGSPATTAPPPCASSAEAAGPASGGAAGAASLEPGGARAKPRSRSLIRRSSRKAKQQMRDAHGADDCNVS
ncbi:GTP-binding protein Di-Ras1 [Schistocerca americana]|uniref:GTP-binding protein Di-Ras1 n=1 Tax=Schistocerca americana TaxID=7009 RepID=UPI001F5039B2|nr:GTP-binding protein Di-Ras1 [Schistocerca americana]XP_049958722.1 GTP-binding protein Di-Ras1 [Schistocerca serialis cubense]